MEGTDIPARQDSKDGIVKDHQAFIQYAKDLIYVNSDNDVCALCQRDYEGVLMSSSVNTEIHALCTKKNPNDPRSECIGVTTEIKSQAKSIAEERPTREAITVTGLTPVVQDVSNEIYNELVSKMLPLFLL